MFEEEVVEYWVGCGVCAEWIRWVGDCLGVLVDFCGSYTVLGVCGLMGMKLFRVLLLVFFYKFRGAHIFVIDPLIVCRGVPFPSHEILSFLPSSVETCVCYLFYFPFFFSVDDVWGWFNEVRAMLGCFFVWGK